jgi:hypothetical protein
VLGSFLDAHWKQRWRCASNKKKTRAIIASAGGDLAPNLIYLMPCVKGTPGSFATNLVTCDCGALGGSWHAFIQVMKSYDSRTCPPDRMRLCVSNC